MAYNNFSISYKKSKFYLKEKQPTDGYEEVIYGTDNKKTYHKYFDRVKGLPSYFGEKEVQFDGRTLHFLELSLEHEGNTNKISVNLKNKGGYTDEAKALISAMDGYKLGEPVSVSVRKSKNTAKNGKTYENLNIYINYDNIKNDQGKGESTGYIDYKDIPSAESSDDGTGGISWNWKPVNVFYFNKLKEIEKKFASDTTENSAPPENQTAAKPKEPATVTADEQDDLPF